MTAVASPVRLLVTGAAGFVGSWVMRILPTRLPPGSSVIAAGRPRAGATAVLPLDLTDRSAVEELVRHARLTCVLHLAAVANVGDARQDPSRAWTTNLFGTMHLADAVMRHAPRARFIFVSTAEVYGRSLVGRARPAGEDTPLEPFSLYGATKAATELMLGQLASEGLDVVRIRPFNHTGPGQDVRFVLPGFAAQIAAIERGRQPPVMRVGNLDVERDFLDVRDVVAAYQAAVLVPDLGCNLVLNVASGQARSVRSMLADLLALSSATGITVEADPARLRSNDVPVLVGDAVQASARLAWNPAISWDRTLRDLLDYQRDLL